MSTWVPEPTVQDCDEVAPEVMASKVYSRRFTSSKSQGEDHIWACVTIGFYCEDQWQAGGEDDAVDLTIGNPVPAEERYRIGQHVEFLRYWDPRDPGGSEYWSAYVDRYSWFARAEKFTEEQMRALAENITAKWIYWDGRIESDDFDVFSNWAEPMEPKEWESFLTEELKGWLFLREAFEFEVCHECKLDADAHIAKRDMFGNWHAWCKIGDPAFALQVLRERIEQADTTKHANGFSDEDSRRQEFEAALYALEEARRLAIPAEQFIDYRKWAVADNPEQREFGRRKLTEEIEYTKGVIERKLANKEA